MSAVIKDADFELMAEIVRPDAKQRLSLGRAGSGGTAFNVYRNRLGQIVLDPVKAIPAYEAWLFENKKALASVKRGLTQAAEGRRVNLGSFAKHVRE
jgi:hypothetical protein